MKKSKALIHTKYQYPLLLLPFSNIWVSVVAGINGIYSKQIFLVYKFILLTGVPYLAVIMILNDALGVKIATFGFINYVISAIFSLLTIKIQQRSFSFDTSRINFSQISDTHNIVNRVMRTPYFFWISGGIFSFIAIRILELQLSFTLELVAWCILVLSSFLTLIAIRMFYIEKKYVYLIFIIIMIIVYATYGFS